MEEVGRLNVEHSTSVVSSAGPVSDKRGYQPQRVIIRAARQDSRFPTDRSLDAVLTSLWVLFRCPPRAYELSFSFLIYMFCCL
jgi:hypothetical protein